MKINIRKKQLICMAIAVLSAVLLTGVLMERRVQSLQKSMAQEVFRFHVLANSDSKEDQAMKMKVKENIITYLKKQMPETANVEQTKEWIKVHLNEIENVSRMTLHVAKSNCNVVAEVTQSYFPDKTYGDITFPKGNYEALRVKIGNAEGQNWWCVLYPNLCFIDAVHAVVPEEGKNELKNVLEEEEYEMVTALSKFKVKWFFFQ